MGSGRDKRKKQKGKAAGVGAEKTSKKTEANASKLERRLDRKIEGGEDDLDALLERFRLEDRARTAVRVEAPCPPPPARVFATFTPLGPEKTADILLYGGEHTDSKTDRVATFGDVYVLHTQEQHWSRVTIPNSPSPRSAHQAVFYKGAVYIFGGEVTSPNQEKFRHFRELWKLTVGGNKWAWQMLPSRSGPSPRSGHRMALHGSRLVVFGGFFDDGKRTSYYSDVWLFDLEESEWRLLERASQAGAGPSPRGGSQVAVYKDSLLVYGGHCVVREGKTETDHVYDDLWTLDLKAQTWQRVKKSGIAPSKRASFGLVTHRKHAVVFGGVTDRAGQRERLFSELHADLHQLNLDSLRWFPVRVGAPPPQKPQKPQGSAAAAAPVPAASSSPEAAAGKQTAQPGDVTAAPGPSPSQQEPRPQSGTPDTASLAGAPGDTPSGDAAVLRGDVESYLQRGGLDKDSPIYRAAVRIQARYRGFAVRKAVKTYRLGGSLSELLYSPAVLGVDFAAGDAPRPRPRANPLLAVVGGTLWLLGGVVEIAHTDITLDDLWTLDLVRLDGWRCLRANTEGEEVFREDEEGWETDDDSQSAQGEAEEEGGSEGRRPP